MINLKDIKNQKFNLIQVIKILFYTFPISFIIGNLVLSLHLLLFVVFSLFLITKKQLNLRFKNSYWLLIAFFLYLFLLTTIQFQSSEFLKETTREWPLESDPIFKSFILIRFFILIFVIDILFFNKILNLKKLFLTSFVCVSFVSFDIILQYITGFDVLGLESSGDRNSGPFGDEYIAGSYLQKFSFLSFFYIYENFKNKKNNNLFLIFLLSLNATGMLLAGNRMPMLLFLFGCLIMILLIKNLRFVISLSLVAFLSIFLIIIQYDENIKNTYRGFINTINIIKIIKFKKDSQKTQNTKETKIKKIDTEKIYLGMSGHNAIYRTTIIMWKQQPLFGSGLKSFRIKCWEIISKKEIPGLSCSTHSHNYYLELLVEAGIIGASLMIIFFLILLKDSFYFLKEYNHKTNSKITLIIPIIIVMFLEIWPLRSSGSFFTTGNATFLWLIVGILLTTNVRKRISKS